MLKMIVQLIVLMGVSSALNAEVFTGSRWMIKKELVLDEAANVEFSFKHQHTSQKGYYQFSVSGGKVSRGSNNHLNIYPDISTTSETKVNLPLKSGKYNLKLWSNTYYDKPFDFKITKTPGNFEQEPNNNMSDANLIKENINYTGYIQRTGGAKRYDFYKFSLDRNSMVNLGLTLDEKCNEGAGYEGFDISLYDSHEKSLIEELEMRDQNSKESIGLTAGEYFVKVKYPRWNDKSNPREDSVCVAGRAYHLSYSIMEDRYVEFEPNDNTKTATVINPGVNYQAKMQRKFSEVDYYSFNVPSVQSVSLEFKHDYIETNQPFNISVYNAQNKRVKDFSSKGIDSESQFTLSLKQGDYFIRVSDRIGLKEKREYSIKVIVSGKKRKTAEQSSKDSPNQKKSSSESQLSPEESAFLDKVDARL